MTAACTEQEHFLARTLTIRVPVDRSDPASVAAAFEALKSLDATKPESIPKNALIEVSPSKYWKRPKE